MSLLNLWKTIRGNTAQSDTAQTSQAKAKTARTRKPARAGKATQADEAQPGPMPIEKRKQAKPTKPKKGVFGLGGSQGAICRLVKRSGAVSVLEIGVGDGARALAVTRSLVEANPNETVCYAAIDRFEMADGPITLKEFHQQLRAQSVKPTLIPMDTVAGLARVSSTIGIVDLVLIAEPNDEVNLTTLAPALARITNENSSVYELANDKWRKVDVHQSVQRRAA